jgi:hypothetical protein
MFKFNGNGWLAVSIFGKYGVGSPRLGHGNLPSQWGVSSKG